MSNIIQILLEEHRNIDRLLLVLERELEIFDRSEEPDYEILQAVIQYFQDYPENCHHPKEGMVFEKLKVRALSAFQKPYPLSDDGSSRGSLGNTGLQPAKSRSPVPRCDRRFPAHAQERGANDRCCGALRAESE